MKRKFFKAKYIIIFFIVAVVVSVFIAWAAGSLNTGFILFNNSDKQIDVTSLNRTCKVVHNNDTGKDYFIPTKTAAEWDSFIAHLPPNVVLTDCTSPCVPKVPCTGSQECGTDDCGNSCGPVCQINYHCDVHNFCVPNPL